jgi:hypothetical protein
MEQTTQQIIQKTSLPIKSKIAAWWLIIGGIILGIARSVQVLFLIFAFLNINVKNIFASLLSISLSLFPLLFLILFFAGIFLLRNKKWSWQLAKTVLYIGSLSLIYCWIMIFLFPIGDVTDQNLIIFTGLLPYTFFIVPPLIFLIIDRKNFFKIAS